MYARGEPKNFEPWREIFHRSVLPLQFGKLVTFEVIDKV
jgi:hypothetical protein